MSNNPKVAVKEKNRYFTRTKSKQKRIEMYRDRGHLSHELPDSRIAPDRKWFGNTRTITQDELAEFQNAYKEAKQDPFTVIVRAQKLPKTLVEDANDERRSHLLKSESYQDTFGKKSKRIKPNIGVSNLSALIAQADEQQHSFDTRVDEDKSDRGTIEMGQTKRVLGEVYKVIDSSDVIIQVLDARDPMGTRSRKLEEFMAKECPHKHLVFLINKVDLVPRWVIEKAVRRLSREKPTIAFRASTDRPFGDESLTALLRQFQVLHKDRAHLCVGFVGYPNVGKSSVINSLRRGEVCPVAPIPGETKVWRYITLTKRIYLIDCPGHVYPEDATDAERVMKGVTRVERLTEPAHYIDYILQRTRPEYIHRTYQVESCDDVDQLLEKIAVRYGRLTKGGKPDTDFAARKIIFDFQRGRLPWFVLVNVESIIPAPDAKRQQFKVLKPDLSKIQTTVKFAPEDEQEPAEDDNPDNLLQDQADEAAVADVHIPTAQEVGDDAAPAEKDN